MKSIYFDEIPEITSADKSIKWTPIKKKQLIRIRTYVMYNLLNINLMSLLSILNWRWFCFVVNAAARRFLWHHLRGKYRRRRTSASSLSMDGLDGRDQVNDGICYFPLLLTFLLYYSFTFYYDSLHRIPSFILDI